MPELLNVEQEGKSGTSKVWSGHHYLASDHHASYGNFELQRPCIACEHASSKKQYRISSFP